MNSAQYYLLGADALLFLHVLVVLFITLSLLLILVGKHRQWAWVRNFWFRISHLVAIGIVVLQSWLGVICPLTTWEMALREKAGEATYSGTFISHWLQELLYYNAPWWVFVLAYSIFAALVIISWFWVKPRR